MIIMITINIITSVASVSTILTHIHTQERERERERWKIWYIANEIKHELVFLHKKDSYFV